jgi:urease accessory protein
MTFRVAHIAATVAALLTLSDAALAHTGVGDAHGLVHGFMHPIGGADHVLAMVAVGLYAALLGGRALWVVPASFVTMMAIGMAGVAVPYTEAGIAVSVVVLGLAVALWLNIPTLAATALVGLFAIFHGHAHGAEMPLGATSYSYAAGFLLATALLHAAGVGVGLLFGAFGERAGARRVQAGGGAIALAGLAILIRAA